MRFIPIPLTISFAVLAILASRADAVSLTVNNSSFESPTAAPGNFVGGESSGPANWSVYETAPFDDYRYFGVWNPTGTTSYLDPTPHGSNMGVVFLLNTTSIGEAGLVQVLSSTLQLSTTYTLRTEVGNFAPVVGSPYDFTGFPGYRVDLLAGGTVIATDNNTLAPEEGRFLTSTVTFTTGLSHVNAGQALSIRLVNLNGTGVEVNFDDVRLEAVPVPEPAAGFLLGASALLLVRRRR